MENITFPKEFKADTVTLNIVLFGVIFSLILVVSCVYLFFT